MNNKGQLLITDLLLWLVIITIILGIIIYLTTSINDKQVQESNNYELIQLADNTMDMLIKTEGTPTDWENLSNNQIETPGLKDHDTNQISYKKLVKLKQENHLLKRLLPNGINYVLNLYPEKDKSKKTIIDSNDILNNSNNLQISTTSIIINYGYKIYNFTNYNYNNNYSLNRYDGNYNCLIQNINKTQLEKGNYYLVTRNQQNFKLSNSYNNILSGNTERYTNINNQLITLLNNNENETIFIYVDGNNNDSYLVYDENDNYENLNSILNPEIYKLELSVSL